MKKFLSFMFNFGKKYRAREEKYHSDSVKHGRSMVLIEIIIYTLVPILSIIGLRFLPWDGGTGWLTALKVFCFLFGFTLFFAPSELMITGIVALRHRARMKVQNAIENKVQDVLDDITNENVEENKDEKPRVAKGTANKYDLVVGILGILCSIAVVVTCVLLICSFFWADVKKL